MEYFILQEGVKQGPFDLITMIKKVKNGSLTGNTMVSEKTDGPFREAEMVDEVAILIREHANPSPATLSGSGHYANISLSAAFHEGLELWVRRVVEYTIFAAIIMGIAYVINATMRGFLAVHPIIPVYFGTLVLMTLFFEFCYYVLETKRSQRVHAKEFMAVAKRTFFPFLLFSAVLSLFVLGFGISMSVGLVTTTIALVALTFLIFAPFIATDSGMGIFRAAKISAQRVRTMGADNFGVVLAIVSFNIFAAVLPALIGPELLGLGLFISLPVTISALSYIYDQIFI